MIWAGWDRASMRKQPRTTKGRGITTLTIALLSFAAIAAISGGGTLLGSLVAGSLNPVFLIGTPLGLYWIVKREPLD
jgi:hypothetical protein